MVPGGHDWHVLLSAAPIAVENVPEEQLVHGELVQAQSPAYVPGVHWQH